MEAVIKAYHRCVLGFFFLLSAVLASAAPNEPIPSQAIMSVWTDREGLPSNSIMDVLQDKKGYIWLASYDGLVRFNGYQFKTFSPSDGFTGKSARVLALAPDGALWIGTNAAGLYVYQNGQFRSYGKADGLPDLSVRAIAFDASGAVLVGTAGGLARLDDERFIPLAASASLDIGIANFLLPLADGAVLVGSNMAGLFALRAGTVERFYPDSGLPRLSYSAAVSDDQGRLWLGTADGRLFQIKADGEISAIEFPALLGASINELRLEADDSIWIASDHGIGVIRGASLSLFSEEDGLPSNVVSGLWRDSEGSLWASTERGGVVKLSPGKFVNFTKRDGLIADAVNAVVEDAYRSLWIATDSGVSFLPKETDPYHQGGERRRLVDELVEKLSAVRVRQIRAEPDGSLWFATYSSYGLLSFNANGDIQTLNSADGLPNDRVRFSFRDSSGALWIGTTAGPARYSDGRVVRFGAESGLTNLFILGASEDPSGRVWLGTDGGGAAFYQDGRFVHLTKADGLAGDIVFRVFWDKAGRGWFCTSDGLSLYHGGDFHNASAALGLMDASVFEAFEDGAGRLWVLTARKAVAVSSEAAAAAVLNAYPVSENFTEYDRLDGLAGQLSANAWACAAFDGSVHLPTLGGVSSYDPASGRRSLPPTPVFVEAATVDGQLVGIGGGRIELAPNAKRLDLVYAALSYMVPQRIRFRYQLSGYDPVWLDADAKHEISYTNLPPGSYSFRLSARNDSGVWTEAKDVLSIVKRPYFYQTPWFYILAAAALASSGFLAAYLHIHRLKRRAERLDRLVANRTKELAEEKAKSDRLLLNVLPPAIADELKEAGRARPKTYASASVLFADIVNFTASSAKAAPAETIDMLNKLFTGFDEIMDRYACERIKTLGDGYLAVCGLPTPIHDHVARLASAGVAMLRYLEDFNQERDEAVRVRVGLAAGPVVGGVVGVKKYIFDVFGATVNLAFRLEASSTPMGFTVSKEAAAALDGTFCLWRRPDRAVKGYGSVSSYYINYRNSGLTRQELEVKADQAEKALTAGDRAAAKRLIETLDLTLLEPDQGQILLEVL